MPEGSTLFKSASKKRIEQTAKQEYKQLLRLKHEHDGGHTFSNEYKKLPQELLADISEANTLDDHSHSGSVATSSKRGEDKDEAMGILQHIDQHEEGHTKLTLTSLAPQGYT